MLHRISKGCSYNAGRLVALLKIDFELKIGAALQEEHRCIARDHSAHFHINATRKHQPMNMAEVGCPGAAVSSWGLCVRLCTIRRSPWVRLSLQGVDCEQPLTNPVGTNRAASLASLGTVWAILSVLSQLPGRCSCGKTWNPRFWMKFWVRWKSSPFRTHSGCEGAPLKTSSLTSNGKWCTKII